MKEVVKVAVPVIAVAAAVTLLKIGAKNLGL